MKKAWNYISTMFAGMIMSISDIIPGFSGGIALTIVGKIKEVWSTTDLILKPQKKGDRLKGIIFYTFFVIGSTAGVFGFSQIIRLLMVHAPAITFWFFLFLTMGSIFVYFAYNRVKIKELKEKENKRTSSWVGLSIGFMSIMTIIVVTFILRGTFTKEDINPEPGTSDNLKDWSVRFLVYTAGFIGAASMVTPGVSGALMILMLGSYGYIYSDLYPFPGDHPVVLVVYMLSTVLGTVTSMLLLNRLYKKFSQFMNWFFVGTILASSIGMIWLFNSILIPEELWRWSLIVVSSSLAIAITYFIVRKFKNKDDSIESMENV